MVVRPVAGAIGVGGNVASQMQTYSAPLSNLSGGTWTTNSYGANGVIGEFSTSRLSTAAAGTEGWFTAGQRTGISPRRGYRWRVNPNGGADYRHTGHVWANAAAGTGVLVGWDSGNPGNARRAMHLISANGTTQAPVPGGSGVRSEGFGISLNGLVLSGFDADVGGATTRAFVWTVGDPGMTLLARLSGDTQSTAIAVNNNRTAAGFSSDGTTARAVIWDTTGTWDSTGQPRLVTDLLAAAGVNLSNWTRLTRVTTMSDDGTTVAGWGVWAADGTTRGFIATIPEPATLLLLTLGGLASIRRRH